MDFGFQLNKLRQIKDSGFFLDYWTLTGFSKDFSSMVSLRKLDFWFFVGFHSFILASSRTLDLESLINHT